MLGRWITDRDEWVVEVDEIKLSFNDIYRICVLASISVQPEDIEKYDPAFLESLAKAKRVHKKAKERGRKNDV